MLHRSLLTVLLCALLAVTGSAPRFAVGATAGVRLVTSTASVATQGYLVGFGVGGVGSYAVAPRVAVHADVLYAGFGSDTGKVLLSLLGSFGGQYDVGKARVFADAGYGYGFSSVAEGSDGKLRQISVAAGLAVTF